MTPFPDTQAIEYHFKITEANTVLLTALQNHCPSSVSFSNQQFKQLCEMGAVWVAQPHPKTGKTTRPGRFRRAKKRLPINSEVSVYINSQVLNATVATPLLIADEGDFSVWYKPKGMLSQGSKWGDHTTLYRWIERNQPFEIQPQRPCWPVHRLDKATDGLMLISHSKKRAQQLAQQFESRYLQKVYQAWVSGNFCAAFPAWPHHIQTPVQDKPAHTEVQGCHYDAEQNRSLLNIKLHTGRKHQIRIHLAEAGFAIIGDRLYGQASSEDIDLQLTAVKLTLLPNADQPLKTYQLPESLRLG
ncbi:RNA pseudouridine synthase [Hydrogenovibrio sp. SC-1]|uniref:pseudouridine synthase family protein n=1 Tax=Hydrogenovibrio sp. SC-1 TaxID=2065820 RepID=UPI000C7CDDF2|nr:RNA pseudouridine synthase [Hydrogenovibrio sp. SC-1]PLA75118.1 RNA pseudouridine synthase [Hydrogenovibrio sp. SC-1]